MPTQSSLFASKLILATLAILMGWTGAHGQGLLTNGAIHSGTISQAEEAHDWTFEANEGDFVLLSIAETDDGTGFTPWLRVFRPDGTQLGAQIGRAHV